MSHLEGHDRYSGSMRRVTVGEDMGHVVLTVQAYDGDGEVMLTPGQARAVAAWLFQAAEAADVVDPVAGVEPLDPAALERLRERLAELDPP